MLAVIDTNVLVSAAINREGVPGQLVAKIRALAAGRPIVTGNGRHFPADCGAEILSPAQCLERLMG